MYTSLAYNVKRKRCLIADGNSSRGTELLEDLRRTGITDDEVGIVLPVQRDDEASFCHKHRLRLLCPFSGSFDRNLRTIIRRSAAVTNKCNSLQPSIWRGFCVKRVITTWETTSHANNQSDQNAYSHEVSTQVSCPPSTNQAKGFSPLTIPGFRGI